MDIECPTQGGSYYRLLSRDFELDDLKLLAECVHATKFISKSKAKELVEKIGSLGSNFAAEQLQEEVFYSSCTVEISDQFLAWVCGFRKKATIIAPSDVVEDMKNFLSDISDRYKNE